MDRSRPHTGRSVARASFGMSLVYTVAACGLEPEPGARELLHRHVVFALGYGHLLASVARVPSHADARRRTARAAIALVGGYAVYAELCARVPALPVALLVVSAWHTVENHRAIARSPLDAPAPIAPLRAAPRQLAADGLAGVAIGATAFALPALTGATAWLGTADVVAAFTVHHLVTWLLLVVARARRRAAVASSLAMLTRLHAPMLLVCGLAIVAHAHRGDLPQFVVAACDAILAPATYLFWSAAHVVHTAWRRRPH